MSPPISVPTSPVEFALRYAAAGFSVLPIVCDGTKRPAIDTWKDLENRILSETEIRACFNQRTGVALICGKVSGNLETLDIDDAELVEPFETLVNELSPGLLDRLPTVATPREGGGGRHYRYRTTSPVGGSTKLALSELRPQYDKDGSPIIDKRTGLQRYAPETLIETRGEGGYALAPGCPGNCHESGLTYVQCGGPSLDEIPVITDEDRRTLWGVAAQFNRFVKEQEVAAPPRTKHSRSGLSPGDDYAASVGWEEILAPAGWVKVRSSGPLTFWRRPGKSLGTSATTGVLSSAGQDLFCVFTSSAYPFEGPSAGRKCTSYGKFAAYSVLNHGGDFSAAARALAKQGYGNPTSVRSMSSKPMRMPTKFQPFPTEVLPPACRDYVQQSAHSIDCDESMVALPLLAAISAAIGNTCRLALKRDYSEPAVIWSAIVGDSGSRKSAAIDAATKHLKKREAELQKRYRDELVNYNTEKERARHRVSKRSRDVSATRDESQTELMRPIASRHLVSDVTTEALAVRLEQNPRGLLLARDELSGFFGGLNQYKSGGKGNDEAAFLAMFGARSLTMDRKNIEQPSIHVPMAHLSITGSIQPGVLQRVFTRERMESGMAARFLLTCPPTRAVRWSEESVEASVEERLERIFERILAVELRFDGHTGEPAPYSLSLSRDAKDLWVQFHNEHSAEQALLAGDLAAAWSKLTGYAPRLALIWELAAWAAAPEDHALIQVDVSAMQAAIQLVRWFSCETRRIYGLLDESTDEREVRELVEYIHRRGGQVTARDLVRGPARYRNELDLAEADLRRLASGGLGDLVSRAPGERGGRPTQVFTLLGHCRTSPPCTKSHSAAQKGREE